jgi:hypothetical protein
MMIAWSKPVETAEQEPRHVRVLGEGTGGAIDYVNVMLGEGGSAHSRYRHSPGEYCAGRVSGLIRGDLAVRNINGGKLVK